MIIPEINKAYRRQWIVAIQVSLLMGTMGANYGWLSPFLGKLNRPDPPFQANGEQISWVASTANMSRMISIIAGSIAANYFGTKTILHSCGFFFIVSWICLICAKSITLVLISQFLCGLAMGTTYTIFPLYLGEILSANVRGTIVSFAVNLNMIGVVYGNVMGSHVDPWIYGTANLVITGIFFITFYFVPSTPLYFINCNKLEEAENALRYYNNSADVSEEFAKLLGFINSSPQVSFLESFRRLKDPINLKTFVVMNVVFSIFAFSGTYSILEYMEVIIMASKIDIILPSTLVTIMSVITIPGSWVAVVIGDKFGRVTMLLASAVIFCGSFILWGINFHFLDYGFNPTDVQWLVLLAALVYRLNMSVGLNPILPVLLGELFAPNVKSVSACLCNFTASLCIFISVKNFQLMAEHMTYKYLFYLYAGLVMGIGIFTKIYIPETKGKTLQEIQEILKKNYIPETKGKTLQEIQEILKKNYIPETKGKTLQEIQEILKKNNMNSTKKLPTQVYVNTICEQSTVTDVNITKL